MTIEKLRFRRAPPGSEGGAPAQAAPRVVIEGTTAPHATVVVENKSIATFAPVDTADAFARGKADASGAFAIELPAAREGDHVSVRAEVKARGVVGALAVRVANVEAVDGRAPVVRQQGLRLVANGAAPDGQTRFAFAQVCRSETVGEPGQALRFTNLRTKYTATFALDDAGRLPGDATLAGAPGDVWKLATSDGAHNTKLTDACGSLVAPDAGATMTAALRAHRPSSTVELTAPLFAAGGPKERTAKQGEIGNCWLVSVADAVASARPERLRERMRDNGDGTITVRFARWDRERARYVDEDVTVDRRVPARSGKALYGTMTSDESWFPLLEKAYAQWKGGYDGISSGYPFEAFEALLGAEGTHFDHDVSAPEALWRALSRQAARGDAVVAWTRVDTRSLSFANTGLAGDHAYAVLGVEQREGPNGPERVVRLRNPWGQNPWAANGGKLGLRSSSGGVLEMPFDAYVRYFAGTGAAPTT